MNLIPADIRENWQDIRPGLAEIAAENDAAWIPEDIYCMVRNGEASLYLTEGRRGFVILQVRQDAHRGTLVLHIVAAWVEGDDAQEVFMAPVQEIARKEGCLQLEFDTRRKGFMRRGGWEVDRIVYRKDVAHG